MKKLLELLPDDTNKSSAVISLFIAVVLTLTVSIPSGDFVISGAMGFGCGLILFIWLVTGELLGQRRHHRILDTTGFLDLQQNGFEIEEKNQYKGLTGEFDGYIFDIYYDWAAYVLRKINRAVVFNVYFISPINLNGETDIEALETLSKKHEVSRWEFKNHNFWWRDGNLVMGKGIGVFNPSSRKLWKCMRMTTKILKSEGLKPRAKAFKPLDIITTHLV